MGAPHAKHGFGKQQDIHACKPVPACRIMSYTAKASMRAQCLRQADYAVT